MSSKIFFTVGPSQVFPTVKKHIQKALDLNIPSISHRGQEFKQIYQELDQNLKKLLKIPPDHQIFLVSSALEAMERTIQGTVKKDSFHVITGSFGKTWTKIAQNLGKTTQIQEAEPGQGIDLKNLSVPLQSETICLTHNDTSTGVTLEIKDIENLKKKFPQKIIALDVVSSIPYVDINYKFIDIVLLSVQKGFGLPAGLGVLIVSPQALKRAQNLQNNGVVVGSYHSLISLSEKAKEFQTPETPNVLNIWLLNQVLKDMLKVGIKKIRQETEIKSKIFYNFFDKHPKYKVFVKNKINRSNTVIVIDVAGESKIIRDRLKKHNFEVSSGYGPFKEQHIRIANFPTHTKKQVEALLNLI